MQVSVFIQRIVKPLSLIEGVISPNLYLRVMVMMTMIIISLRGISTGESEKIKEEARESRSQSFSFWAKVGIYSRHRVGTFRTLTLKKRRDMNGMHVPCSRVCCFASITCECRLHRKLWASYTFSAWEHRRASYLCRDIEDLCVGRLFCWAWLPPQTEPRRLPEATLHLWKRT